MGWGGLILQSFPLLSPHLQASQPAPSLAAAPLLVEPIPRSIHFTNPAQTTSAIIAEQDCGSGPLVVTPAVVGVALSHASIAKKNLNTTATAK